MLQILLSTLIILPCLSGIGNLTEKIFGKFSSGIVLQIILGIFSTTIAASLISFILPINIYVEIIFLTVGWFLFLKNKLYQNFYQLFKKNKALIGIWGVLIIFAGSFAPFILDHFGYYVPSILWLQEFGLVKGISNLDLILGQMSFWHIFQAVFSHFSDSFLKINSVLLFIYALYIIEKKVWLHFLFIPFLFFFIQSPSPDLPVIVFALIILQEIFNKNDNHSLILGLSILVFAIKPTMIWLPIFSFLYLLLISKTHFKNYILGGLILLLFFFKNIWTFGYPVFPITFLDLNIPWKPNPELMKASSQMAILKTYDMQYSIEEIREFSTWESIKNWLFLKGMKSYINIIFIAVLIGFIIISSIKKNKMISFICVAVLIKSVFVLLFSAQYRFFIDVFFVFFMILLHEIITKKIAISFSFALTFIIILFLSIPQTLQKTVPSFRLGKMMSPFQWSQIYQPTTYQLNKFYSFKIGSLNFNISKNYPFNFDTQIPAISTSYFFDDYHLKIIPQPVDSSNFKKGFIWKNMNEEEKKQAQKIIQYLEKNNQPK